MKIKLTYLTYTMTTNLDINHECDILDPLNSHLVGSLTIDIPSLPNIRINYIDKILEGISGVKMLVKQENAHNHDLLGVAQHGSQYYGSRIKQKYSLHDKHVSRNDDLTKATLVAMIGRMQMNPTYTYQYTIPKYCDLIDKIELPKLNLDYIARIGYECDGDQVILSEVKVEANQECVLDLDCVLNVISLHARFYIEFASPIELDEITHIVCNTYYLDGESHGILTRMDEKVFSI